MDLRGQVEALPRFVLVTQDRGGWTLASGREAEPCLNEVVLLADVLALVGDSPFDVPQGEARPDA